MWCFLQFHVTVQFLWYVLLWFLLFPSVLWVAPSAARLVAAVVALVAVAVPVALVAAALVVAAAVWVGLPFEGTGGLVLFLSLSHHLLPTPTRTLVGFCRSGCC